MSIRSVVREYWLSQTFVRTFALLLGLSVITIVTSLSISTIQYEKEVSNQIRLTHDLVADRMAKEMTLFFEQTEVQLALIGDLIKNLDPNGAPLTTAFNDMSVRAEHFEAITYFGQGGIIIASTNQERKYTNKSTAIARDKAYAGEVWYSQIMLDRNRVPYIEIAIPVVRRGEVIGALVANISLKKLWWWIEQINQIPSTTLSIVRVEDGQVVADQSIVTIGLVHPQWQDPLPNETILSDDEKYYVSYKPLTGISLVLITMSVRETFFNHIYEVRYVVAIVAVLLMLVSVVVAAIMAARSTRPLMSLINAIHQFGEIEGSRAPEGMRGEYGRIAEAFNEMADEIELNRSTLVKQESLVMVGRLSSALAHELRHGLQIIQSMIFLMSDTDEEVKRDLKVTVRDMTRSIHNILEFARSGQIETAPVTVEDLVAEAVDNVRYLDVAEKAEITFAHLSGPETAMLDHDKMMAALSNLLRNAVEGGATKVSATSEGIGDQLVFTISDNGPGIEESIREQVFEPFFTTRRKGFGIGLAFTRIVARSHGGDIRIVSSGEEGTQFALSVPVKEAEVEERTETMETVEENTR